MRTKSFPDLSLNPNNVKIGDTVTKNNHIGLVTDILSNNGHKVLQFWVKWSQSTATVPSSELASLLTVIPDLNHDLINQKVNGGFIHSFIYHSGEIKVQVIKDSGLPILFSLEDIELKLKEGNGGHRGGNGEIETVNINTLIIDPNLQQRVKINQDIISDYSITMSEGEIFPPIIIWRCDDGQLYLVDGFHRVEAAKLAKIDELPFIEKSGSYRDAMLFTLTVNYAHGLRRNNADKRKAVLTLLNDPEWSQLSTRELAKLAKVSHQLVHKMRIEIAENNRHQENWQDIKDYSEIKDEIETVNIYTTPKNNQIIHPSDVIKFLDDFDEEEEKEINLPTFPPEISLDVLHISKDTFSILCDRHTVNELEKFMKAEGITNGQTALAQLLNFYHITKNSCQ